jgi:hypothetical protein
MKHVSEIIGDNMGYNIKMSTGGGGNMMDDGMIAGVHQGTIKKVEPAQAKKYQSEELEDVIFFTFETPHGECKYKVRQTFCPNPPSNLYKVIKALNPGAISGGQIKDPNSAAQVVAALKGKTCMINVEEYTGQDGSPRLKVAAVMAAVSNGAPPKQEKLEDPGFDKDIIPF